MSDAVRDAVIPLSSPLLAGNEWVYVKDCLDTGWVSSAGSYVDRFEGRMAEYLGVSSAVATVNGTAALHVSLLVTGVGPGDEVIVPSLTFIAPVNVVRYCGAYPVFMDCERSTLCLDVGKVLQFFEQECEQRSKALFNRRSGRRIKAIIPVHVFGHPADMAALDSACAGSGVKILEDAAESLGSEFRGRKTGTMGRLGCLSFNGNKIITTGGGGMVVTDDDELAQRARHLTTQGRRDDLECDHDTVGYNYRLTNIQAALGVAQMEQLETFIETKRRNAMLYRELLAPLEHVEFLWEQPGVRSNFWFYTIRQDRRHKDPLMRHLISRQIQVRPVFKPIHDLPIYRGFQAFQMEQATAAYDSCLSLPCSVHLREEQIGLVVDSIVEYFRSAG